jgi:hypothetical protein
MLFHLSRKKSTPLAVLSPAAAELDKQGDSAEEQHLTA